MIKVEGEMGKRLAKTSDGDQQAQWRARLARFGASAQTVTAFCAGESVSVPSFYYWRSKLAGGSGAVGRRVSVPARFIEVGSAQLAAPRGAVGSALADGNVELQLDLGAGVLVRIRRF